MHTYMERIAEALQGQIDWLELEAESMGCNAGNFDGGSTENCEHCQYRRMASELRGVLSDNSQHTNPTQNATRQAMIEWAKHDVLCRDYWDEDLDEEELPTDDEIETQRQKALSLTLYVLFGKSDSVSLFALRSALTASGAP